MDKNRSAAIETLKRMSRIRTELLNEYPFFGRLLLHLIPAVTDCGTACTDMTYLAFDPVFAASLSDDEMKFVMLHEVMHCVLKHCIRGKTLDKVLYNAACDIVVNSLIIEAMGVDTFTLAGEEPMHLAPNGWEGRLFSAEEVYAMLLKEADDQLSNGADDDNGSSGNDDPAKNGSGSNKTDSRPSGTVDSHEIWSDISDNKAASLGDRWELHVKNASKVCGSFSGVPLGVRRYLDETDRMPRTNWKQVLAEFIRHNRADFTFMKRDTRYTGDIIMPSFVENMYGDAADNLWFCVDASGSVTDDMLATVYAEIISACVQIDELTGQIAFFDTRLSAFTPFECKEDLAAVKPVGGGGTAFECIFDRLAECDQDERPVGIIIMTDGYARFPKEETALGVPVLWVIIDSDVVPEWGAAVYIRQ